MWFPQSPLTFELGEEGEVPVEWENFRVLPGGTRVKVTGTVLWRDGPGRNLLVGDGWGKRVQVVLRPTSSGTHVRHGDPVIIHGRLAIDDDEERTEREFPRVNRAILLRQPDSRGD